MAEHEDDDDHWRGGADLVDHYHRVRYKWWRVIIIMTTSSDI